MTAMRKITGTLTRLKNDSRFHGITDKQLRASIGFDETLDEAIEYYLDQDTVDDDGDEEDNWDFDEAEE